MRASRTLLAAGALATCTLGLPARAESILLDVPVQLRRLPTAVEQGAVTCIVFGRRPDRKAPGEHYLGSGSERFATRRGGFEGRVVVPVTLDVPESEPGNYRCTLYFVYRDGETRRARSARSLAEGDLPGFRADTQDGYAPEVTGVVR
jgi:hypothetical protein